MKTLVCDIDSALFDLDGTLVETNIDFALMRREMIRMAAEVGLAQDDMQKLDILGIVNAGVQSLGDGSDRAMQYRGEAMNILEEIELRHAHETKEIPFAREIISRLNEMGVPTGIVTRNCRAASEVSLKIAQITTDVMICREDSSLHKPHPEPVLIALSRLNARPANSVMVGDHTMDVLSGKAAGTKTIGFRRPHQPENMFDGAGPDLIISDLREVLGAIIGCAG